MAIILVVENGSGSPYVATESLPVDGWPEETPIPDANTYIDITFFNEYCEQMGYDISSATQINKETAILRGMAYIESKLYKGYKTADKQSCEWPRDDVRDRNDVAIPSNEIPLNLKKAQAECSYQEYIEPNILQPSISKDDRVVAKSIGPISKSWARNDANNITFFPRISAYLKGLTKASGLSGIIIRS